MASASAGAGDFTLHSDFNSVSADFRILITGGTGAGVFSPDITLQGTTNESMGTYLLPFSRSRVRLALARVAV
jgi:hypothetical protein